jgi:hypothetical protein
MEVIAATVASDPEKFNEAFLGIPNEAYCAWILDNEKWEVSFYFVTFVQQTFLDFVQQTLTILSVSSIPTCELYMSY